MKMERPAWALLGACAASASEAIARAAAFNPDVVIMDLRLAIGSSDVVAARELYERHALRCIFVSANLNESTRTALMPYELIDFLGKPVFAALAATSPKKGRRLDRFVTRHEPRGDARPAGEWRASRQLRIGEKEHACRQRIGRCNLSATLCRFHCCFLDIGQIDAIVVGHGRSTTPDVKVVARHSNTFLPKQTLSVGIRSAHKKSSAWTSIIWGIVRAPS